jgi:hypothetical protein
MAKILALTSKRSAKTAKPVSPAFKAAATRKANAAAKIEAARVEAARVAALTPGQKAMETKRANGNLSEIALKAAATRRANRESTPAAATPATPAVVFKTAGLPDSSKAALLAELLRQIASL